MMQLDRNKKTFAASLGAILLWCATTSTSLAGGDVSYDTNSWKTMIPASCQSFFDGCNNCRRAEGSAIAACTRKACQEYQQPRCLDGPIMEGSVGDNRFRVYYGEYVAGDMRVALDEDEVMLSDRQTHTASRLKRERAASGAKYSDGKLEFWEHGGEAMLRNEGQKLYQNCSIEN
jgi:hypothetical protein